MYGIFKIDPVSGNLTLNKTLDPAETLAYDLELDVYDTSLSSGMNLSVIVKTGKI